VKARPAIPRFSAFTLVELLVVVAIVAILASLVVSAVSRGKMTSQRIACISKLRQWGQGVHLYSEDHNDKLPQEAVFDGINTWEMTTFSICSEVWYNATPRALGVLSAAAYSQTPSSQRAFYSRRSFFHCPSARFAPVSATYPNFSLAMNSKLMMDFESGPAAMFDIGFRELRVSQIVVPVQTALFLDAGVAGEERLSSRPIPGSPRRTPVNFQAATTKPETYFSSPEMCPLFRDGM
jgi:prepilin-type N-terminal cleavage/methylation domain-containing protein